VAAAERFRHFERAARRLPRHAFHRQRGDEIKWRKRRI
jgi:hypothetical protein